MKQRSVVIAFLLLLAATANATTVDISFIGLPQHQVNGIYVGNSHASSGDVQEFNVLCGDFNSTTNIPGGPITFFESYIPSLTDVRFTGGDTLTTYRTAAILLDLLDRLREPNDYTVGSYQFAIWKLFTPSVGDYGNSATLLTNAQDTVANGGNAYAYDNLRVFTPVGTAASNQEFLAMDYANNFPAPAPASAPEPASLIMIGSGLLLLGSARFSLPARVRAHFLAAP